MVFFFFFCVCVHGSHWRASSAMSLEVIYEKWQKMQLLQPFHNVTGTGVVDRAPLKEGSNTQGDTRISGAFMSSFLSFFMQTLAWGNKHFYILCHNCAPNFKLPRKSADHFYYLNLIQNHSMAWKSLPLILRQGSLHETDIFFKPHVRVCIVKLCWNSSSVIEMRLTCCVITCSFEQANNSNLPLKAGGSVCEAHVKELGLLLHSQFACWERRKFVFFSNYMFWDVNNSPLSYSLFLPLCVLYLFS